MKNLFVIVMMIMCFCLTGCSHLKFEPNSVTVGIQFTAINAGSEFAYKYKDNVKDANKLCDAVLDSKGDVDYLFNLAKQEIAKLVVDNPTQAASIAILFDSVKAEGQVDLKKFQMAAEYFKKGMDLRK